MHDNHCLRMARERLNGCASTAEMAGLIKDAVMRNEAWRGQQCLNLIAAESPTSLAARALLSSEVGTRASGGHIGRDNRFFAGLGIVDELEALSIELLKRAFCCTYADHRLMGGMGGVLAAYMALTQPGDQVMSVAQRHGGDSSHSLMGPPGVRGLHITDIPFTHDGLVDLDRFQALAIQHQPKVVAVGMGLSLFPFPIADMKEIICGWGGRLYYDAAHQLGLIAAGLFQDPLKEGADIMTGSSGKTFSGPQGGIILWNDPQLTPIISDTLFPTLTGSHQINRVAALAVATSEMLEFGRAYMGQVVNNAQSLGAALSAQGLSVLFAHANYTQTHQVVIQVPESLQAARYVRRLEKANIICNAVHLPGDDRQAHGRQSGIRLGTTEVTRRGMKEAQMQWIAEHIADVVLARKRPSVVAHEVSLFMGDYRTLYFCHDSGTPE